MTLDLEPPPAEAREGDGGAPARRAMVRWAWRLFRREWRQQFLILALIVVAVGATVVGSAVATDTPPPADSGFGTAQDMVTIEHPGPGAAARIAALERQVRKVDVIQNEALPIPGSIETYLLRSQNPSGPFGQPLLSLVSGHYPRGAGQVAMTAGLASAFGLKVGDMWHQESGTRRLVGIVENPQSLLEAFALVAPGQVHNPTEITVLFDAHGIPVAKIGPNVQSVTMAGNHNTFNPETIVLGLATVGMLLIALVSVGGFTVLAQRRMRSIGMVESIGATDRNVRLVVRANGVVVGIVGTLVGLVLGMAAWLAYRPALEQNAHHLISPWAVPWTVIGPAMALAVLATYFAAARPARAITRVPVVAALSGRPSPPKQIRRSAVPGIVLLVIAFVLFTLAARGNGNGGGEIELVLAFVVLIAAVILLSPFCLSILGRLGRRAPVSLRLALRDLARYRTRSSSALAAISLGVLIAVIICVIAAGRYGNVLDYAGPNLASNQLNVYTPTGPYGGGTTPGPHSPPTAGQLAAMGTAAHQIAAGLGSRDVVELESVNASLQHAAKGRNYNGPLYVATPSLLRAFGISASTIAPGADILTMRPGLATISKMQLVYGNYFQTSKGGGPATAPNAFACPKSDCLANPKIQEVSALPGGTSAPNTVITERAVHQFHLHLTTAGWLIQTAAPLTAAQITDARLAAATAHLSVETKSSAPSSSEIINWATVFGIALALGILAMSVGLIRSETARDLRTLAAAGASGRTRRSITGATAGALGLAGAILGTVGGYVAAIAWFRSTKYTGGFTALTHAPVTNLLLIVVGMPLLAAAVGWLLAGREPPMVAHQPME